MALIRICIDENLNISIYLIILFSGVLSTRRPMYVSSFDHFRQNFNSFIHISWLLGFNSKSINTLFRKCVVSLMLIKIDTDYEIYDGS